MQSDDKTTEKEMKSHPLGEPGAAPPRSPPTLNADVRGQREGSLFDVLGPVLLHGVLLVGLIVFARFVVPRFVDIFAGLNAPLPVFTRIVLGLSYSLSNSWLLVIWLGLALDCLLSMAILWIGGRNACRLYGIVVAVVLILLAIAGVIGLSLAMASAGIR